MRKIIFEGLDNCGVGVEQIVGSTGVQGLNVEIHPA